MGIDLEFQQIRQVELFSEFAIRGLRMAEVIRTNRKNQHWAVFCYIANRMVPHKVIQPSYSFVPHNENLSYRQAKRKAVQFLESTKEYPTGKTDSFWLRPEQRVETPI